MKQTKKKQTKKKQTKKKQTKKKQALLKPKEELKEKSEIFALNFSKKKKLSDIKGMIKEVKFNKNTSQAFLITMFRRNGTRSNFIVFPKNNSFVYNKKRYIIDEEFKFYDNETRNWGLNYHEDISIPLNIKLDVSSITTNLDLNDNEVRTAINPYTLEIYMKSSFVEKIMKGEEMDKIFKKIILLGTVSAVGIVATLLIILKQSGVIDNLL